MTVANREIKEESCILIAEVDGASYYYNVAVPEIEKGIRAIEASYNAYNKICSRIYIGGFTLVTEGSNLSIQDISDRVCFYTTMNSNREVSNTPALGR